MVLRKDVLKPIVLPIVPKVTAFSAALEKAQGVSAPGIINYLMRIAFATVPGGATPNPIWNANIIPLPYKAMVLKQMHTYLCVTAAGGSKRTVNHELIIVCQEPPGDVIEGTFGAPTPATTTPNPSGSRYNIRFARGGAIPSGASQSDTIFEPFETLPWRFGPSGFSFLLQAFAAPTFGATDTIEFELDMYFEVVLK